MSASNVVAPDFFRAQGTGGEAIDAGPATDRAFEAFWRLCPKKVGKPLAFAKWRAITSASGLRTKTFDRDSNSYVDIELKASPEEMIEGMKLYCREQCPTSTWDEIAKGRAKLKDGGKYTCQPATWLNQGRWMT